MPWPWPTDSPTDRARRVALSYRRLMELTLAGEISDPAAALVKLDTKWQELGQHWLIPSMVPLDLDEWLPAGEMAELFHVDPRAFRDWHRRGHIRMIVNANHQRCYCVGDVVEYARSRTSR